MEISTYDGYFEKGQFFIEGKKRIKIPENKRILITILDEEDEEYDKKSRREKKHLAMKNFIETIQNIKNENVDDLNEIIEKQKLNITRELDL